MVKKPTQGIYADKIQESVREWFRIQNKVFTLKELAAFAGVGVTPSFRKRIRQLVDAGELASQFVGFGAGRGSTVIYMKPEWVVISDLYDVDPVNYD